MSNKINIFLDSNAIYKDPLFKNAFGKLLIQLSQNDKIDIFLSKVVYEESANNFEKIILKNKELLTQIQRELNSLLNKAPKISNLNIENIKYKFSSFYENRISDNSFSIIDFDENYLEELVRRSIKRIPPFSETRQEFRDAVIWLSYLNYIKKHRLVQNIFITNNKKDFWNAENSDLHPELRKEIKDLKVYNSIADFCSNEKSLLKIKGEKEFTDWLKNNPIDNTLIRDLLTSQVWHPIKLKISESIDKLNPSSYFNNENYAYFEYQYGKDGIKVANIDIRQITDFALISCKVTLKGFGIFYPKDYYWKKDKGEIEIVLNISFNINKDLIITDLSIEKIIMNYAQYRIKSNTGKSGIN